MSLAPGWRRLVAEALAFFPNLGGAIPRGDDEDFDLRAPRDGPGWRLLMDVNVRAPRDGLSSGFLG
jgi:hypothetical protein